MILIRSILFWPGYIFSIVVFCSLLTIFFFIPQRNLSFISGLLAKSVLGWLAISCNIRHEIEGIENIPEEAFIAMGNHQSSWETSACQLFFNPATWVAKRELLWIPIFGWGLWAIKPIALDRSAGRKAIEKLLKQGEDRLKNGISIIIFPEGTRISPDEQPPFKVGASLLAARTGVQIVPFAHDAGKYWTKGFLKHPGTIKIVIGKPIDTKGMKADEINKVVEAWVRTTQDKLNQEN